MNAIDQRGETAMHKFAGNGVTSILKLLVSYNANICCIDMTGNTPLMLAIKEDRESAVDFLIRGTEINISNRDGESALHISAELYQPTTTSLLLEHGADVNAQILDDETSLHVASRRNNLAAAKLLLDRGVDNRIRNKYKGKKDETALHMACR